MIEHSFLFFYKIEKSKSYCIYCIALYRSFMDVNYKILDTQRITDYISTSANEVSVENIILYSGADKLRVYPALFELEQSGWLEVVEREELGAPSVVRRKRHEDK